MDLVLVYPLQFITRRQSIQLEFCWSNTLWKDHLDIQSPANSANKRHNIQSCPRKSFVEIYCCCYNWKHGIWRFGQVIKNHAKHKWQTQIVWWMWKRGKPYMLSQWKTMKSIFHSGMWRTGSTCTCWVKRWRTSSSLLPTPTSSSTTSRTVIRSSFHPICFGESQIFWFNFLINEN